MCSINNRTKWYATLVMAAASLPVVSAAQGAVMYAFDQPTYQVLAGGAVSVPLYLTFSGADLTALNAGNGLASVGASLTTLTPPTNPALLSGFAGAPLDFDGWVLVPDPTVPGDFMVDQSGTIFPASMARLYFFAITPSGGVAATGSRVLVGNLNFQAGTVMGQTTTFNVAMVSSPTWAASTAGAMGVPLVSFTNIGAAPLSVTVVPEPTTALSLVVLAGAGLVTRGSRRQRHQATAK